MLSSPTNAQTTVVVDPITGMTITVTDSQPLTEIKNNPNAVSVFTGDDGVVNVPLGFVFPYFGEEFNQSWMYTNGAISFTNQSGNFCCDGENLDVVYQNGSLQYNYSITPLWSDLYSNPNQMYYLGTEESMTYGWYGISEYDAPANLNSFEVQLYSSGDVDLRYGGADVTSHAVTVGLVGDMSQGEYYQFYHGQGFNLDSPISGPDICVIDPLSSTECSGYQQAYFNQQCGIDPLYNSGCPGYQQAYHAQQCAISPLFDSTCPGYQEAFFQAQCAADPLYDQMCPGYGQAYFDQQCAADPLFNSGCNGYADAFYTKQCSINPLYDTGCKGYAEAYYDQQCKINPLYDSGCKGYAEAYYYQQCSINPLYDSGCNGYDDAYFLLQCDLDPLYDSQCQGYPEAYYALQCTLDPLYDTECPGYSQAFYNQQCSLNPLYDTGCPGYEVAFYNFQCSLNPLYDTGCPGYAKAYALTYIVETTPKDPGNQTAEERTSQTLEEVLAGNKPIDLGTYTQELVPPARQEIRLAEPEEAPREKKSNEELVAAALGEGPPKGGEKKEPMSKEDADKKKQQIANKINEIAKQMAAANDPKKQEELQATIAALLAYVPGFDAYYTTIPDTQFYEQEQAYQDQQINETVNVLRMGLASELKYDEMVQMQYNRRD